MRKQVEHLLVALVFVAAALAGATSALGWQGPPVVNEEFRPPPDVHPLTWCGEVQGTAVDTIVEHYMQDASGNIIDRLVRFGRNGLCQVHDGDRYSHRAV